MHLGGLSAVEIESGRTPLDALYMTDSILSQRRVPADVKETLERHKFLRQLVDDHRRYAFDLMSDQYNQHHQYYDRAELPPGSYAYVLAKHLTSDEQRAGLADAAKLRDRYWGPYKVLKWVNSADVELEIPVLFTSRARLPAARACDMLTGRIYRYYSCRASTPMTLF